MAEGDKFTITFGPGAPALSPQKFAPTASFRPHSTSFSFSHQTRFTNGSIYGDLHVSSRPQQPRYNIPSIIQRMKLQLLQHELEYNKNMDNFRRQNAKIKSTNGRALASKQKPGQTARVQFFRRLSTSKGKDSTIIPPPIPYCVDAFGNRSSQVQRVTNYHPQQSSKLSDSRRTTTRERYFSTSRKVNLARPLNFNPGPGHYEQRRYLEGLPAVRKS